MLSVLIYGRNDEYGGVAQRRSALSINALAEVLGDDDEIIFVDYNTDNHKLTFPEMIADTLTARSRDLVKVVRVRPEQHSALALAQAGPVVESIARNIGLRHTNPANRWVLSTNPDIVIVPPDEGLGALLGNLTDGYYAAPRFELPRMLWQRLPRDDPAAVQQAIAQFAGALHLDEVVAHYLPAIGYDAPGDFQLILRSDLFDMGGFNEAMQRAWHVDANMMARLAVKYGVPHSLADHLRIYHCEHTADTMAKHSHGRAEDSFEDFVTHVSAMAANAGKPWGGEALEFEAFALKDAYGFEVAEAVSEVIGRPQTASYHAVYGPQSFDRVPRPDDHTLTFVVDRLFPLPRSSKLVWIGSDPALRERVEQALGRLGFSHPLMTPDDPDALMLADLVLFDGPGGDHSADQRRQMEAHLTALLDAETARHNNGQALRQIIAVNAIHTSFEAFLVAHFDVVLCPFTTRLRPAVMRPGSFGVGPWLRDLSVGPAGERSAESDDIFFLQGHEGHVFYGPYKTLGAGRYQVMVGIGCGSGNSARLVLEVVQGETFLAQVNLLVPAGGETVSQLDFVVRDGAVLGGADPIQVRLWSDGQGAGAVTQVTVAQL